jgi:hypothetical protein
MRLPPNDPIAESADDVIKEVIFYPPKILCFAISSVIDILNLLGGY